MMNFAFFFVLSISANKTEHKSILLCEYMAYWILQLKAGLLQYRRYIDKKTTTKICGKYTYNDNAILSLKWE